MRKHRQRPAERGANAAPGQPVLGFGRKPASEVHAALDPSQFSPEYPRHLRGRVMVILHERADHPGLVERRGGAGRSVGLQKELLLAPD